jgi:hypothetical protein
MTPELSYPNLSFSLVQCSNPLLLKTLNSGFTVSTIFNAVAEKGALVQIHPNESHIKTPRIKTDCKASI